MRKVFMGVRLRRLREERGMTQAALADALGISTSYLSQLEKNQRPLTVPVLLKINAVMAVDVQLFSEDDEARLIADLRDVLSDVEAIEQPSITEIREIASNMPAIGRAFVTLHKRYREGEERIEAMAARLGDDWPTEAPRPMPYEEVRDFFYARHNYIAELDEAAELLYGRASLSPGTVNAGLIAWLSRHHGVRVVSEPIPDDGTQRRFDPANKVLYLSSELRPGQQAFQMATQLAFMEMDKVLERLTGEGAFSGDEARALARIGLANYFAGALILPYGIFHRSAEALRYDIERLGRHFGVGFETVCHRLSTLQRTDMPGVPFFFIRVDRAGNISKRQSATDFHFSRVGGACPLWNVYAAFAQPGHILTQIAQMPDGRTYLWVARTVSRGAEGYGTPGKTFAIGLGCDIRHASRLIYAKGLDLTDLAAAIPIGAGCRVCERPNCSQRAFPPIGKRMAVNENRSRFAPYPVG